jgi:hypothetical protein
LRTCHLCVASRTFYVTLCHAASCAAVRGTAAAAAAPVQLRVLHDGRDRVLQAGSIRTLRKGGRCGAGGDVCTNV